MSSEPAPAGGDTGAVGGVSRVDVAAAVLVAASVLVGLFLAPDLPDRIAVHWGPSGEPDGYASRTVGLAFGPVLAAGVYLAMRLVPAIDPLGENVAAFRDVYHGFVLAVVGLLVYVHAFVLLWNAGVEVSPGQALAPVLAGVFYGTGVLLAHAKRNWFVGVRTPWTLSDEAVWDRTHERAAPLFKAAGVLALAGLAVPEYAVVVAVAPVVLASGYAVVYSYVVYRRLHAE